MFKNKEECEENKKKNIKLPLIKIYIDYFLDIKMISMISSIRKRYDCKEAIVSQEGELEVSIRKYSELKLV